MGRRQVIGGCAALALAGCAQIFGGADGPQPAALPETQANGSGSAVAAPPPPRDAATVEEFDTTTAAARAAAASAPAEAGGQEPLGTTIASLGDPAQPGFWAETPLVDRVRQGQLTFAQTGKSVTVELRPSGGGAGTGTRVSLAAMRVLDAPLTALPELTVTGL
ncbi:MAG: hypothetical protein AAF865_16795 [Pseudomonadota bacterium]